MSAASCLYGNVKKKVAPLVSLFWAPMMGGMQMTSCMLLIPAPVSATLLGKTSGSYDMLQITAIDENLLDEIGAAAVNRVRSLHDNYEKDCYNVTNMATYIDLLDTVINVFTIFIAARAERSYRWRRSP